jgi:hypothetical protein
MTKFFCTNFVEMGTPLSGSLPASEEREKEQRLLIASSHICPALLVAPNFV